jgi:hypothetical protein
MKNSIKVRDISIIRNYGNWLFQESQHDRNLKLWLFQSEKLHNETLRLQNPSKERMNIKLSSHGMLFDAT